MSVPTAMSRSLRRFGTLSVLVSGIALGMVQPATAIVVLDQNQPVTDGSYSLFTFPFRTQSFQQTADNMAGAGVYMRGANSAMADVTIALWDAKPGATGSNLLASGTVTPDLPAKTDFAWVDVFWTPVAVTAGQTYYLDFTSLAVNSADALVLMSDNGNPYAFGSSFNASFIPLANYDYTFRTYADIRRGSDVPEPASLSVLALSLLGLSAARRR